MTRPDHTSTARTTSSEMYADGIPLGGRAATDPYAPPNPEPTGAVASAVRAASRVRSIEGWRGYSVRVSVWLRYGVYFLTVLFSAAAAHWAFSTQAAWKFGGLMMLYTVSYMAVVAAIGTVFYAESRMKIAEQFRQFTFGIVCLPGAGIALLSRILGQALNTESAQGDQFLSLLTGNGVMLVYFATVVIPAAVFTKYVFGGVRTAHRSGLADEEAVALYQRQDGLQR